MIHGGDPFSSPYTDMQEMDESSHTKKSKKKKKKYDKDGEPHKHKKSKHKKERRHSSSKHESHGQQQNAVGLYDGSGVNVGSRSISDHIQSVFIPNISANLQDSLGGTLHAYANPVKDQLLLNSPTGVYQTDSVSSYTNYATLVQSNTVSSPIAITALPTNQLMTIDHPLAAGQANLGSQIFITNHPPTANLELNMAPNVVNLSAASTPPMSPGNFLGLHSIGSQHFQQVHMQNIVDGKSRRHRNSETMKNEDHGNKLDLKDNQTDYSHKHSDKKEFEPERKQIPDRFGPPGSNKKQLGAFAGNNKSQKSTHPATNEKSQLPHQAHQSQQNQPIHPDRFAAPNVQPSSFGNTATSTHPPSITQPPTSVNIKPNDHPQNYNYQQSDPSRPGDKNLLNPQLQQKNSFNLPPQNFNPQVDQFRHPIPNLRGPPPGNFQPTRFNHPPQGFQGNFNRPPNIPQQQQQQQQQQQPNFSKPPPNFNRPPTAFSKPPPDFKPPLDFSKQTSKFAKPSNSTQDLATQPPPDFTQRPPADFTHQPPSINQEQPNFQNAAQNFSNQPPPDFSKPPPNFPMRPDFSKPPPGFPNHVPDFTKPPPNFNPRAPPPNFSHPPSQGFEQPLRNQPPMQNPPQNLGNQCNPRMQFQERFSNSNFNGQQAVNHPHPNHAQRQQNYPSNNDRLSAPMYNQPNQPAVTIDKPYDPQSRYVSRFDQSNSSAVDYRRPPENSYQERQGSYNDHINRQPDQYSQKNDDFAHQSNQGEVSTDLATTDYSKIVQALETIQSNSYDHSTADENSQHGNDLDATDREEKKKKKKKKEKKEKKEKKKELKKRLLEKKAELASLNDDSEKPPNTLSIKINPIQSKFNLKIDSPLLKGNVFQKYKAAQLEKKDSPLFANRHTERNYRSTMASGDDDEDSDTDKEMDETKNADPQNKEELMKMLGIEQTKPAQKTADDAVYSGSEEGEVVSEDEEERQRIKQIIQTAKEEACKDPTEMPTMQKIGVNQTTPAVGHSFAEHDGEPSSEGEVSSDGELSDDSVDEFGRLKKLRQRDSDDDRKYGYSSGTDSSNSDDERERWNPTSQEERSRSRSRSLTPELEQESKWKPEEEEVVLETSTSNQQPEEETEEMRIQKQTEAVEQERLRQEVAKLENQIEPGVVRREIIHKPEDSDSSNTDVSDNEDKEEAHTEPITESKDDNLKHQIMQRILEKQKEEKAKSNEANIQAEKTTDETIIKHEQNVQDIEMATEDASHEEEQEEKEIDMFADSGDEADTKGKSKNDVAIQEDVDRKKEISPNVVEPMQEDVVKSESSLETEPTVETDPGQDDNNEVAKETPEVDTLKSLHDLRNKMDQMTSEELEMALKSLPSGTNQTTDVDDGRTTPVHLRDIEVPIQSLTEFVYDQKVLFKQLFRSVNKKEFKRMLPKYLRKYDVKTVRDWCLDEMEIISKKRIRSLIMQQMLASSSSESEDEEDEKKKQVVAAATTEKDEESTSAVAPVDVKTENNTEDKGKKKKNKKKDKQKKKKKKSFDVKNVKIEQEKEPLESTEKAAANTNIEEPTVDVQEPLDGKVDIKQEPIEPESEKIEDQHVESTNELTNQTGDLDSMDKSTAEKNTIASTGDVEETSTSNVTNVKTENSDVIETETGGENVTAENTVTESNEEVKAENSREVSDNSTTEPSQDVSNKEATRENLPLEGSNKNEISKSTPEVSNKDSTAETSLDVSKEAATKSEMSENNESSSDSDSDDDDESASSDDDGEEQEEQEEEENASKVKIKKGKSTDSDDDGDGDVEMVSSDDLSDDSSDDEEEEDDDDDGDDDNDGSAESENDDSSVKDAKKRHAKFNKESKEKERESSRRHGHRHEQKRHQKSSKKKGDKSSSESDDEQNSSREAVVKHRKEQTSKFRNPRPDSRTDSKLKYQVTDQRNDEKTRSNRNGRDRQKAPPMEKLSREEYERKKELYRELRKKEYQIQQNDRGGGKKQRDESTNRYPTKKQPSKQQQQQERKGASRKTRKKTESDDENSDENTDDDSEGDDDEDDENQERKRRVTRYYREKEKKKQKAEEMKRRSVTNSGKKRKDEEESSDDDDDDDDSDGSSSSSSSDDDDEEEEGYDDEESYRRQMKSGHHKVRGDHAEKSMDSDRREFMTYLANKRQREQDTSRPKLPPDHLNNMRQSHQSVRRNEQLPQPQQQQQQQPQQQQTKKPEGYDERRRQRELERRKMLGQQQQQQQQQQQSENKRIVTVRSKMYSDNMSTPASNSNNIKKPYDYNNRGRRTSRSPPSESDNPRKISRDSSEIRRRSRDSSETRRPPIKRRVENKRRSVSREEESRKRRKRRDSSGEKYAKPSAKGASHLKELEFRARALQSLISKKEESSKTYNRKNDR